MTRKDYIRLARALGLSLRLTYQDYANNADRELAASAVVKAADRVSAELEQDNPRFDREHFLAVVRGERAAESRPPRAKQCTICAPDVCDDPIAHNPFLE